MSCPYASSHVRRRKRSRSQMTPYRAPFAKYGLEFGGRIGCARPYETYVKASKSGRNKKYCRRPRPSGLRYRKRVKVSSSSSTTKKRRLVKKKKPSSSSLSLKKRVVKRGSKTKPYKTATDAKKSKKYQKAPKGTKVKIYYYSGRTGRLRSVLQK